MPDNSIVYQTSKEKKERFYSDSSEKTSDIINAILTKENTFDTSRQYRISKKTSYYLH